MNYIKKIVTLYTFVHLCANAVNISAMKRDRNEFNNEEENEKNKIRKTGKSTPKTDNEIIQFFDNFLNSFKPDVLIVPKQMSAEEKDRKSFAIALKEYKEKNGEENDVIEIIVANITDFLSLNDIKNMRLTNKELSEKYVTPTLGDAVKGVLISSESLRDAFGKKEKIGRFFIKFDPRWDPKHFLPQNSSNPPKEQITPEDHFLQFAKKIIHNLDFMVLHFNTNQFSPSFLRTFIDICINNNAIEKLKKCKITLEQPMQNQKDFSECLNTIVKNATPELFLNVTNDSLKKSDYPYTVFFKTLNIPEKKPLLVNLVLRDLELNNENALIETTNSPQIRLNKIKIDACQDVKTLLTSYDSYQVQNVTSIKIPIQRKTLKQDHISTFINNAKNLKNLTFNQDEFTNENHGLPNKFAERLIKNTSITNLKIYGLTVHNNVMLGMFEKFTNLSNVLFCNCNMALHNIPIENHKQFPSIKTIDIEDCTSDIASIYQKQDTDCFSIKSLSTLIDSCPNLKSLSLSGLVFCIKNRQKDFERLQKFIEKYALIINEFDICLSNDVPQRFIDNNDTSREIFNTYKENIKKTLEKAYRDKKIKNISHDIEDFFEDALEANDYVENFISIKKHSL